MSALPVTDLAGRVAVVTGGSRGLGAATAEQLARRGAGVVVTYRREAARADEVAERVRRAGVDAWTHPLELADVASIDALFDWAGGPDGPGRLDVLVANAAATRLADLVDLEPRHVERTMAISVTGFLACVRRAVPLMEAAGGGRVVAVSGIDTTSWAPGHGLLAAAKAAMETLVTYLNIELGPRGITVVGVSPDAFFGDSLKLMLGDHYERLLAENARTHPLRESATPEAMAQVVALLCTDAARWLSGHTVMADGAASFAQRGIAVGLAARLLAGGDGPSAPSVPDL